MERWLASEDEDDASAEVEVPAEWTDKLIRPEASMAVYRLFTALEGKHLPWPGALLDQPDWWLHDVALLAARKALLRKKRKAEKRGRERLAALKKRVDRRKRGRLPGSRG